MLYEILIKRHQIFVHLRSWNCINCTETISIKFFSNKYKRKTKQKLYWSLFLVSLVWSEAHRATASTEYRKVVYTSRGGKEIFFKACHDNYNYTLNLLVEKSHYNFVLSATVAFSTAYFSGYCCIGYSSKLGHIQSPPCRNNAAIKCSSCQREFANANCFQNNVLRRICEKFKICQKCYTTYVVKKNTDHICGLKYSNMCTFRMQKWDIAISRNHHHLWHRQLAALQADVSSSIGRGKALFLLQISSWQREPK